MADGAGVDFVLEDEHRIRVVAVKSGPNPYNASQKRRQHDEFIAVRNRLYKMQKQFDPVLAHAYGRLNKSNTNYIYRESSGQAFWQELTGDPDFYLKLIRLMRDAPAEHRESYEPQWAAAVNRFTAEFVKDYCFSDGSIDWEKLVQYVSETRKSKTS